MVEFITIGHNVFNTTSNRVVDYIYLLMQEGPIVWTDNEDGLKLVADWCSTLYPQRLLLHKYLSHSETLHKGILYTVTMENLSTLPAPYIVCSRGMFIPQTNLLLRTIHFVDDNREHNRESYREYQKCGIKPRTHNLEVGKLST